MRKITVKIGDHLFPSMRAAARELKVSPALIDYHLNHGTEANLLLPREERQPQRKPVEIDGVHYPSRAKAIDKLGLTRYQMDKRIKEQSDER